MLTHFGLKFLVWPMVLAMALVLVAACSSDGDDDDDTNVGAPAATQVPAAPQATIAATAAPVAMTPATDKVVIGAQLPSLISNNVGREIGRAHV